MESTRTTAREVRAADHERRAIKLFAARARETVRIDLPLQDCSVSRDGAEVVVAFHDAKTGRRLTLRFAPRGAETLGALVSNAGNATEHEPDFDFGVRADWTTNDPTKD